VFKPTDHPRVCQRVRAPTSEKSFAAAAWLNEYTQSETADGALRLGSRCFCLASSQAAGSKCYSFLRRFVDPSISFMPPRWVLYFSRMPSLRAQSESRLDVSWSARCVYFVL
jgi:hypothetical protein